MEIKERIARIMATENLTASHFADKIGVQRSSISHVLSGRNKPSLDYLQKILNSFTNYNAEWLIMGTGEPKKGLKSSNLFSNPQISQTKPIVKEESKEEAHEQEIEKEQESEPIAIESKTKPPIELPITKDSDIEKIVVFYTNGTFKSYKPK